MSTSTRQVQLRRHRTGRESCAELTSVATVELPEPGPGQVAVRVTHLYLNAVQADLMGDDPGLPMPGFRVGAPLYASLVGEVTASRSEDVPTGAAVTFVGGWQEQTVLDAGDVTLVDPAFPAPECALNQGLTAHIGMVEVAAVGPGDVVLVSGAAGGVGCLAGQIARLRGAARVIGTAGGAERTAFLTDELGYDVALDHSGGDLETRLEDAAPDGIDVYFDLVGGEQFEVALRHAADGARFALCGAVAGQHDDTVEAHPRLDLMKAIVGGLTLRGFTSTPTPERQAAWEEDYRRWLAEGRIVFPHVLIPGGLDAAAHALDELLDRRHCGSVIVSV